MVHATLNAARIAVLIFAPGITPITEFAIQGLEVLCNHLQNQTDKHNRKLCDLLTALRFRIEAERAEGKTANEDWTRHFQSLFERICEHVDTCESKSPVAAGLGALESSRKVAAFSKEIDHLCESMTFT